jgi:hypothetical protein
VKVGVWGESFKKKKKLNEGRGEKKVPKRKLTSGLRKGKKIKSTCRPPWLAQGPKKIPSAMDGAMVGAECGPKKIFKHIYFWTFLKTDYIFMTCCLITKMKKENAAHNLPCHKLTHLIT